MQNKCKVNGIDYGSYQLGVGAALDVVKVDNPFCHVEIAEQGAQVLSFYSKKNAKHVLWCTPSHYFKANKAIRGGIPFCFPWFGNHPSDKNLPAHGFARNSVWQLQAVEQLADQSHQIIFSLQDNETTRQYWPHAFIAEMKMNCAEKLTLEFTLTNKDQQAYSFGFAWHSYFAVDEILNTKIEGFDSTAYLDQLTMQQGIHQGDIQFVEEFDRIYQNTSGHYWVKSAENITQIDSPTCQSAVVWNPWQDKTIRLGDVEEKAWHQFVCVESGQIAQHEVIVQPQQQLAYRLDIQML